MMRLLAALLVAALAGWALAEARSLGSTEAFSGSDSDGQPAVFAVGVVLAGEPVASLDAVSAYADCATACRLNATCSTFMFCGSQAGCGLPDNSTLASQECVLLANTNCTLAPSVVARGTEEGVDSLLVSGFPARSKVPPAMPGLVVTQAQGVSGGDFSCPDSVVAGSCAFRGVQAAAFRCSSLLIGTCQSVVVYANGTDGCSPNLLAVLKTTKPLPDNTYWAPTVYILNKKNEGGTFILYGEATLTPPDNATLLDELATVPADGGPGGVPANASAAPAAASTAANVSTTPAPMCLGEGATTWMGCILVTVPAIMSGTVNRTLDGVLSAEACCRACRAAGRQACNIFNYCPANATCSFQDAISTVALQAQQCELRYQELVDPSSGILPYLLAKGASAGSFRAGAPVSAWGPQLPGYDRSIAGGLYGQPGTPCPDRIKPEYQECTLSAPLPQLADRCSGDPLCSAVISKPCGSLGSTAVNVGVLRQAQGANASLMVVNPTSVVYFKQQAPTSSSGLSSGAIAGIAVGCAVGAIAAAAGGWVLVRRRRAARAAAPADDAEKALKSGSGVPAAVVPGATWDAGAGYRGTLGSAPQEPCTASTSSKASLPSSQRHGSSSGAYAAGAAGGAAGGSAGSGAVLMGAVIGRPTAASPFAAARARMTPPASAACSPATSASADAMALGGGVGYPAVGAPSGSDAGLLSSGEGSGTQVEPELQLELSRALGELIEHRRVEEEAAWSDLSGGELSAAETSGSESRPASQPLDRAALPASLQEWLIPFNEVHYLRRPNGELAVLGEGASGRVIRAELRGELVAAKEIEVGRALELQHAFIAEAQQLCNLRHANILLFYGCCVDKGKGILLTELCEGRDLGSVLQLEHAPGRRAFGWCRHGCRIAFEVAKALNYLHSRNVAHMDIKSNNILLTSRGVSKVADVGLARMQTRTVMSDLPQMIGTFAWVAPEVLLGGQGCTLAVDIFSYGVLLWEIITGERPVRGHMRSIRVPAECPQEAADLMAACCSLDPAARPSARDVMQQLQAMLLAQRESRRSEV